MHHHDSSAEAAAVVEDIVAAGCKAAAVRADLADEAAAGGLVDAAVRAVGPLTCLINNASVFEDDRAETATQASWDRHMAVNLRAPFVLAQAFCRQLPAGQPGNIINLIDQRVWNLTPMFMSYTLSKAGLWTLTQTLAMALAPQVRVNAIGPGPVLPSVRQTPENFHRQWLTAPLARQVELPEICEAVRFLLAASSVTGQMIAVDAGQHLGWTRAAAALAPRE